MVMKVYQQAPNHNKIKTKTATAHFGENVQFICSNYSLQKHQYKTVRQISKSRMYM
jgi:hypothetical protein